MGAVILVCGDEPNKDERLIVTQRDGVESRVPPRPDKAVVDPVLESLEGRRLVVFGEDADLAAVALRLLRTELLSTVDVGFVPRTRRSAVSALWRLPVARERLWETAFSGVAQPIPLVRDDAGGVLVGRGLIGPVQGNGYCDDELAVRGKARRIEVTPNPAGADGLLVKVVRPVLLGHRVHSYAGRAFQIGCSPTHPRHDGVTHPRPMTRWTWYRHTEDLRAVR